MEIKDLIGKTITEAKQMKKPEYDDEGWLYLAFSDGTSVFVVSGSGLYSSKSEDGEYPTTIYLSDEEEGVTEEVG